MDMWIGLDWMRDWVGFWLGLHCICGGKIKRRTLYSIISCRASILLQLMYVYIVHDTWLRQCYPLYANVTFGERKHEFDSITHLHACMSLYVFVYIISTQIQLLRASFDVNGTKNEAIYDTCNEIEFFPSSCFYIISRQLPLLADFILSAPTQFSFRFIFQFLLIYIVKGKLFEDSFMKNLNMRKKDYSAVRTINFS